MKTKKWNKKKRWLIIEYSMVLAVVILSISSMVLLVDKEKSAQKQDKEEYKTQENDEKAQEDDTGFDPDTSDTAMEFTLVQEPVTAKDTINLRNKPSQGSDSKIMCVLEHGEIALRVGVSDSGWSKVMIENEVYYAVSSLLTTNLEDAVLTPTPTLKEDDNVKTRFKVVNHKVTAKEAVNLRTLPSVTREDSEVVVKIKNGDVVTRTGINIDLGWSRVEYEGRTLYCVSRYLVTVE